MTSGIILLIVAIVLIVIIAYLVGIIIRKRNDLLIAGLEERKDNLFKLPINEEIEEVKNLHLIGQSQTTFREWSQKWTDLSLNSFTDLEKQIYQVDNLNDGFHFIKVKNETKNIESQLNLVEEDIAAIREALSILKLQEEKNSARVTHALDLYENLQTAIAANEDKFGSTAPEISKQLKTIENEFSQFVALNSSGDPMEAAAILERAEEHTIALGQISEKIPAIVQKLEDEFPDQLEDLENGYSRLLDEGYNFAETDIEQGFQKIREAIRSNADELVNLDLEHARLENEDIQKKIDKLYDLFEREITAKKQVQKISKVLPGYLSHTQTNNDKLLAEHARLSKKYILGELEAASIKSYQADLADLSASLLPGLEDASLQDQPFSKLEKSLAKAMEQVKAIEAGQLEVYESLTQVEKSEARIRQELDKHVNKLHMIKRFMEKRNLPGIPQEFLTTFFTTSSQLEALMDELSRGRINIESVTKLSEVSTAAIANLEETAYRIVQHAVLTEQLLQYSNRYRSFDSNVQASFERALQVFERNFDYQGSFDEISYALETVEPGVTERFVSSYEKTREVIRF